MGLASALRAPARCSAFDLQIVGYMLLSAGTVTGHRCDTSYYFLFFNTLIEDATKLNNYAIVSAEPCRHGLIKCSTLGQHDIWASLTLDVMSYETQC